MSEIRSQKSECEHAKTQDQRPKTGAQSPMSSLNQFTMVQLTIDNAEECQIPNPQSHITNRQTRPRVPDVPDVPSVPFVPSVSVVHDVSDVHGVSANAQCLHSKTKRAKCRSDDTDRPGIRCKLSLNEYSFSRFFVIYSSHFWRISAWTHRWQKII